MVDLLASIPGGEPTSMRHAAIGEFCDWRQLTIASQLNGEVD